MMRTIGLMIVLGLILLSCKRDERSDVEDVFNSFNNYNIKTNGAKIYELTDDETHQYYADLLQKVLELDSVEVTKQNIIDKTNILTARASLTDSALMAASPKDFMILMFTYTNVMDPDKVSATREMEIKDIRVGAKEARAELAPGGRSLPKKVYLKFNKEDGQWKYNLMTMYKFTEDNFNTIIEQAAITHHEFIEIVFSEPAVQAKMIRPLDAIWQPIKKK